MTQTIKQVLGREPVHPFPARMAPGIAFDLLSHASRPLRVLDPMMGSGTVLAIAKARGHHAVGVDIDPLAVLMSRVWTRPIDPDCVTSTAASVLAEAKAAAGRMTTREAYPLGADAETRRFVSYWFDPYARRQLTALSRSIHDVDDKRVRDVLLCAFSRLIISKQSGASLAMDLSHSRPHRVFTVAPIKPFRKFEQAVDRVVANCVSSASHHTGPATRVHRGDARALSLNDGSVDLVLTSPPYLNAIDYMRCSKFSLVWMGFSMEALRRLRSESVGSEAADAIATESVHIQKLIGKLHLRPALRRRDASILARYIMDMEKSLSEVSRVLVSGGRAVYVVGENTVRGTYIPNARILRELAGTVGLTVEGMSARDLPGNRRYLPPPSAQSDPLGGRMRREVVLTFGKD